MQLLKKKKKKEIFSWNYVKFIEEILVVCSSSMVFLLMELQPKIPLALYRQLYTFPSAILLKKGCLNFYVQHENKVLSRHLVFSLAIITDSKLSGKLHHRHHYHVLLTISHHNIDRALHTL